MATRFIGLDLGSTGIKLAEVENDQGSYTVTKQAFMPLEPGMIRDGDISTADVPLVAADLKAFLAAEKFSTRKAVVGLNGVSGIFVNRTTIGWHQPRDFHQAVANQMVGDRSLLVGAPADVVFDSVVLNEFTEEDRKKLDVLLVGASPGLVERITGVAKKAGLTVVGAEPTAFSVLRAVKTVNRREGYLDILVDIGHDVCNIMLHECSRPYALTLRADLGGNDLTKTIMEAIQNDDPEIAARAKQAYTQHASVQRAVDDYLHRLVRAIESTLNTYMTSSQSPVVPAGVTLAGGGALLSGLLDTVQGALQRPTIIARFADEVGGAPEHFHQDNGLSYDYTAAVGLAMGETI